MIGDKKSRSPRRMAVKVLAALGVIAGLAAYGMSIWQCFERSGLGWAVLVAVLPGIAQVFWLGATLHDTGFFTPYTYVCVAAALGLGSAWLLKGEGSASSPP